MTTELSKRKREMKSGWWHQHASRQTAAPLYSKEQWAARRLVLAKVRAAAPHSTTIDSDNYRLWLTERGPLVKGHTLAELRANALAALENADVLNAVVRGGAQ